MTMELKTNTAVRITVGPFLDKTDGITPEVALTATNEHLTLIVDTAGVPTLVLDANATGSSGNNDMVHVTNDDAGYYDLELTAAQLNYLGNAKLSINYVTDHLPVFQEIAIVSAQYWDTKYGSGNISADLKAITAGVDFSATMKTSIETACDATVGGGTGTALTAIPWNASWDAEVQSEVNDEIILQNLDHLCKTATAGVDMTTEVADGTILSRIISNSDTSLFVPATHSMQIVGVDVGAVHTHVGTIDGHITADYAAAEKTAIDDWINGGRLDLLLDAIKVPTDKLVFTVANQLDSNTLTQTADVHLTANSLGDIWDHAGTITSLSVELLLERLYEMVNNKMIVTEATGAVALRNIADSADVATGNVQDLGATTVRAVLTWV